MSKVNDKEITLKYKILPTDIINKIANINLKTKSAWERLALISDGFEITKENWVLGIGGNGWRYTYPNVQEYNYDSKEVHSYPIQTWLENGVVAFLAYLIIVLFVLYKAKTLYKGNYIEDKSIIMALLAIIIHSCLDFDMSFYVILMLVFILIALINKGENIENDEDSNKKKKANFIIPIFLILIVILIMIYDSILLNFKKAITESKYINYEETINFYENIIPYSKDIKEIKIKQVNGHPIETASWFLENEKYFYYNLDMNTTILKETSKNESDENFIKCLEASEKINEDLNKAIYDPDYQLKRLVDLNSMAKTSRQKYEETKNERWNELEKIYNNYILENVENTKLRLEKYEECRYKKSTSNLYIKKVIDIENETNSRIIY